MLQAFSLKYNAFTFFIDYTRFHLRNDPIEKGIIEQFLKMNRLLTLSFGNVYILVKKNQKLIITTY